jgi:hypothetical protein
MTALDELRAKAEHLIIRAKASAAASKRLLQRLRSMHGTAADQLQEVEAPGLVPE